jgi:hypothetical protein
MIACKALSQAPNPDTGQVDVLHVQHALFWRRDLPTQVFLSSEMTISMIQTHAATILNCRMPRERCPFRW